MSTATASPVSAVSAPVSAVSAPVSAVSAPVSAVLLAAMAPATAPAAIGTDLVLSTLVLTRSQTKALAYAKAKTKSNELSDLTVSGNKTDQILGRALQLQMRQAKARGDNNAIRRHIADIQGSGVVGPACPTDSKTTTLKTWGADVLAAIKGKSDSTEKARDARETRLMGLYGAVLAMIAEL